MSSYLFVSRTFSSTHCQLMAPRSSGPWDDLWLLQEWWRLTCGVYWDLPETETVSVGQDLMFITHFFVLAGRNVQVGYCHLGTVLMFGLIKFEAALSVASHYQQDPVDALFIKIIFRVADIIKQTLINPFKVSEPLGVVAKTCQSSLLHVILCIPGFQAYMCAVTTY